MSEWQTDKFIYHGPYGPPDLEAAQQMDDLLAWAAVTIPPDSSLQLGFAHAQRGSAWLDLTVIEKHQLIRYKRFKNKSNDFHYRNEVVVLEEVRPQIIIPRAKWRQTREAVADAKDFHLKVTHKPASERFELEIAFRPEVKDKLYPVDPEGKINYAITTQEDPFRKGFGEEIPLDKQEKLQFRQKIFATTRLWLIYWITGILIGVLLGVSMAGFIATLGSFIALSIVNAKKLRAHLSALGILLTIPLFWTSLFFGRIIGIFLTH